MHFSKFKHSSLIGIVIYVPDIGNLTMDHCSMSYSIWFRVEMLVGYLLSAMNSKLFLSELRINPLNPIGIPIALVLK